MNELETKLDRDVERIVHEGNHEALTARGVREELQKLHGESIVEENRAFITARTLHYAEKEANEREEREQQAKRKREDELKERERKEQERYEKVKQMQEDEQIAASLTELAEGLRKRPKSRAAAAAAAASSSSPRKRKVPPMASTSADAESADAESKKAPKKEKKRNLVYLKPVLADFVGTDQCTRGEVSKKLHDYIKEHNLQNPKNRKEILLDDLLQSIFKRKKFNYFSMNKYLANLCIDVRFMS